MSDDALLASVMRKLLASWNDVEGYGWIAYGDSDCEDEDELVPRIGMDTGCAVTEEEYEALIRACNEKETV